MAGIIISGERHLWSLAEPASKRAIEFLTLHRTCFNAKEKFLRVGNCFKIPFPYLTFVLTVCIYTKN